MFSFIIALAILDALIVLAVFSITTLFIAYVWRKIFPKHKDEIEELLEEY